MSTQPLSIDQMSSALKKRLPQLASVPDDVLVRKVLQRRPELITKMSSPAAGRPMGEELDPVNKSMLDFWLQQGNIAKGAVSPEGLLNVGFAPGAAALNAYREIKAIKEGGVEGGADKTMEQAGAFNPITDTVGGTGANLLDLWLMHKMGKGGGEDPTAAGPLRGSMTRAKSLMDQVEASAKGIPVNHAPAYQIAKRVMELDKRGFTVPKPIRDFVEHIEAQSKPGADALGGKAFMDRGAQVNPLTFEVARDFEKSLGEKIPWDQDPKGVMNGYMKLVREQLGKDSAAALKPHGLDVPYLRAKADFEKAFGARDRFGPIGKIGGKLAGYGAGTQVGHPFMLGYAGGKVGEGMAGSMVDSVVNAGRKSAGRSVESSLDMATRRPTGGVTPAEQVRVAGDRVNSLKMQIDRQRAAGDAGVYNTVSKLREAEDQLSTATKTAWGEKYANSPKTVSNQGGGGANYSAEDLAAIKKRLGIAETPKPPAPIRPPNEVTLNVKGEERSATLSSEQRVKWNEAADRYKTSVEWAKRNFANDPERMRAQVKGAGMRYAAEKRAITGEHTGIEKRNMARREASNYRGKKVTVRGQQGEVTGTSFGKIRVKMPDGTTVSVDPEDIQ